MAVKKRGKVSSHKKSHRKSDVHEVYTLLSWTAPGRPFRKKQRGYFVSIFLFVVLVEIILFLFSEYQFMLVVAALAFLSVVLSTFEPKNFHYKITTQGIQVEDRFYIWSELYDFYFKEVDQMNTLIVRTSSMFPGELRISLGTISEEHVRGLLAGYVPYREVVKLSFVEKSADFLSRSLPLEKQK